MKWPPYALSVKIRNPRHALGFWLPLFIIGPIALVFMLAFLAIVFVFAVVATVFTWQLKWWRPIIVGLPAVLRMLWSLRGLSLDVQKRGSQVDIRFQ
jgi:hypothetical protein